jgi:hypothetical protein
MRQLFCALLAMPVFATAHSAQAGKIITAYDFAQNHVPRCSTTDLEPITMRVSISPKLPPYQFKFTTQPLAAGPGEVHAVGKIEIRYRHQTPLSKQSRRTAYGIGVFASSLPLLM